MGTCRVRWEQAEGDSYLGGRRGGLIFFFFRTKSRNYLKIILKHSFYGDRCLGRSERA